MYLIQDAKNSMNKPASERTQYILMTPHDVSAIVSNDALVRLIKMRKPRAEDALRGGAARGAAAANDDDDD